MTDFTDKDQKWLKEVDRLFKRKPNGLMLYTCDGDIVVCKKGIDSDVSWTIKNSAINACNVLRDVHDDEGYGA